MGGMCTKEQDPDQQGSGTSTPETVKKAMTLQEPLVGNEVHQSVGTSKPEPSSPPGTKNAIQLSKANEAVVDHPLPSGTATTTTKADIEPSNATAAAVAAVDHVVNLASAEIAAVTEKSEGASATLLSPVVETPSASVASPPPPPKDEPKAAAEVFPPSVSFELASSQTSGVEVMASAPMEESAASPSEAVEKIVVIDDESSDICADATSSGGAGANGVKGKIWTCNKCSAAIELSEGETAGKSSKVKKHKQKCGKGK